MPTSKKELEAILKCPITGAPLHALPSDEVVLLMMRIGDQSLVSRQPIALQRPLTGAYQAAGHEIFYPVIDGIMGLLPALALMPPEQLSSMHEGDQTLIDVQTFYNNVGWQAQNGVFQDAQDSEDLREVSQEYILKCHQRLNEHLPKKGRFILDIASGPIQYDAYLAYSNDFDYRICADISIMALQAAQKRCGQKGIYILCDITQLPFQANSIDAIISLHTVYHVPQSRQPLAFAELHRVLAPQGVSLIVYSWGRHSLMMLLTLLPFKLFSKFKRFYPAHKTQQPSLYFHAYPYGWVRREIQSRYDTHIMSWRSVNVPFLKTYVHAAFGGRCLLKCIYALEEKFPRFMGWFGAYPLLISRKSPT